VLGHLVHVLARSGSGAKLPSVGLRLNASKSESRLVTAAIQCERASGAVNVGDAYASSYEL
jgi:hypothetical protein